MVPERWKISTYKQLGIDVVDGDRGNNYPKSTDYLSEGYCLFLGASNILENTISLNGSIFINKEKHSQLKKGVINYGDLILIMRGNGVGRVALYDEDIPYKIARINSGLAIIRSNNEYIDRNYLVHLMRSTVITKQFDSFSFGSAQPQLTIKILNSFKITCSSTPRTNQNRQNPLYLGQSH